MRAATAAMLAATGAMLVAGCAAERPPASVAPLPPAAGVYRLGLGDKLRVNVYGEPQLSGEFQVSGTGVVSMPLIGDVKAVGLTAHELEEALTRRYAAGYLNSPRIAVEMFSFRPFSILGEVSHPGQYPSNEGLTLAGAVALAGGYTYRANKKRVFVRHTGELDEHEVDVRSDPAIAPGDVIRIGERYF